MALTRSHGRARGKFYGCIYHHKRGPAICPNRVQIRQTLLDRALLDAVAEALDARVLELAVDKALARLRAGEAQHLDRRTQIERELSLITSRIARLGEAVASGRATDALLDLLQAEDARKRTIVQELAGFDGTARAGGGAPPRRACTRDALARASGGSAAPAV